MRTYVRVFSMQSSVPPRMHVKARCKTYPRNPKIERFPVPDDKVTWDIEFPNYAPVDYTAPSVAGQPEWADLEYKKNPELKEQSPPQWNLIDGEVDRRSHVGRYMLDPKNNLPRNIMGRTGVCSRGLLGRWGPNHAADPIVTRWKRDPAGNKIRHPDSGKYIVQFIAIKRGDSGEWAIPGGMVDPGETVTMTLKREFSEEALNIMEMSASQRKGILKSVQDLFAKGKEGMVAPGEKISLTLQREFSEETMNSLECSNKGDLIDIQRKVRQFFKSGWEVYRGYVDDPRNTDNAWMETVAFNFHDEKGESVSKFKLHAGDDAVGVKWTDLHGDIKLYASHQHFCELVANKLGAHWKN